MDSVVVITGVVNPVAEVATFAELLVVAVGVGITTMTVPNAVPDGGKVIVVAILPEVVVVVRKAPITLAEGDVVIPPMKLVAEADKVVEALAADADEVVETLVAADVDELEEAVVVLLDLVVGTTMTTVPDAVPEGAIVIVVERSPEVIVVVR